MPYCKHIALHNSVKKSLSYILNPEKTEELLYATSINCMTDDESAYEQMKLVYNQFARDNFDSPPPLVGKGTVKAIHYIQSFSPDDNITPEQAHKVAKAFVRNTFGDDAQAVIVTHVDKKHIHSHIILNSYSLTGQKFYANKESLKRVREHSDGVCKALGIKINPNLTGKGRSMKYNEWQHKHNGTSWKEQIRQLIDELIPTVNSLDELLQAIEECGYEVKRGKYISIRTLEQKKFVRTKTLGEEYTEESLKIRITYREMGPELQSSQDDDSKLWAAYSSIIGDVRILADQHRKVPRKQNVTMPYSADNDLDVYRLSAQLSVMNEDNIRSIKDLEDRKIEQKKLYEKYKGEVNIHIEEYNKMVSLLEQSELFHELSKKTELSPSEQLQLSLSRQAMQNNSMLTLSDVDTLRERARILGNKNAALKEKLNSCKQRYAVYQDILQTYDRLSNRDYVAELVEEERKRQEQLRKKKPKR